MADENLIPLDELISAEALPSDIKFVTDAPAFLSSIFVQGYSPYVSRYRINRFYTGRIVSFERIATEIFGSDGLVLILNPSVDQTRTEFPVSLSINWEILRYLEYFDIQNFDFSIRSVFDLIKTITNTEDRVLLLTFINQKYPWTDEHHSDDEEEIPPGELIDTRMPIEKFIDEFNQVFNPVTPLVLPSEIEDEQAMQDLVEQLRSNGNNYEVQDVVFDMYINNNDSTISNLLIEEFYSEFFGHFTLKDFKKIIIPRIQVTLDNLSLGLEFPRSILQPVDENNNVIEDQNIKSMLVFNVGRLKYSTVTGFDFEEVADFDFNRSQIGNTGFVLEFSGLKLDLSKDSNIEEAIVDGRQNNFVGVFAAFAAITLPKKWFKQENGQTLQIAGRNLLLGTGGISGTVRLETENNTPTEGDDYFWFKIGGDNGFRLGFNWFDLNFKQNKVVSSSIKGALELKKFTYPTDHPSHGDDVKIEIEGHVDDEGGFYLTATTQAFPITLPDVFTYNLKSVSLGRADSESPFFVGTSGTLQFEGFLKDVLHLGPLEIQSLKIYSDGTMEFSGGSISLLEPMVLTLGPVDLTVTAIHYGSHQKEVNGVMRKFNYFGFDGGLNVDPLGVEIRGDGIKFYYCTDDLSPKLDPYVHIQTIYLDLTLPANTPAAIINGWLSIPEPGVSPEYAGGLKLQLPKVGITGSVDMKLMPRYPAFVLDAAIEFPAPIPLGTFAIYGFRGLLGYRYVAEKEAIGLVSGVNTWYDYYKKPPRGIHVQKFRGPNDTADYPDPFSLGAGASLGTSFDNGTVFNLKVMLLLSTPSMFMLDGRATILSARLGLEDTKDPPFFAMAAIGDDSVEFAFGADFKLPSNSGSMLKLYAEMQAAFFFNNSSKWYVNFGTKERPTTATILSLVELKSYLMLSSIGIEAGARGELNFNRTYAGIIKVRAWAYIEVGGRISFERPQFGAYLDAGVGAEIKVKFVDLSASFDILFAVEASEPFLIYGRVRLSISIRIAWVFKFSFHATVDVLWEHSKYVNRTPINPLTYSTDPKFIEQLVKGVNMLSNETFELHYLGQVPIPHNTLDPNILQRIIPLDTYIDIKTQKGLLPGGNVATMIGGISNPAQKYTDLVPPDKSVKGKDLRQVKHQYSIVDIQLKFWHPTLGMWRDYHPYKALYPDDNTTEWDNLKIGQFQKSDGQYNAVRLLATTPFSYTEQGEPGWFIPEQYGMTAADFFCEGEEMTGRCADFLEKPLGQQYFCVDINHMFYSREVAFLLIDKEDDEYAFISNHPNVFGFEQSLAFDIHNKLQIILPEPSVNVKLKLTSDSQAVRIRYYAPHIDDLALEVPYGHPNPEAPNQGTSYTVIINADDLDQVIEYHRPEWRAVKKIIIEPVYGRRALISNISNDLTLVNNINLQNQLGLIQWYYQSPIPLMNQLDYLNDFNGILRVRNYIFDSANNRYMDKRNQKWMQSWDVKGDHKILENPIGFSLNGSTVTIESDYQLIDMELIPEQAAPIEIKNDGYRATITVPDITKYLTPEGYLDLGVDFYENCKNDKRLCSLGTGLTAIQHNFIDPAIVRPDELPAMQKAMTRFKYLTNEFDLRYPDYELMKKVADPVKDIDSFISKGDAAAYPLAYAGAQAIKVQVIDEGDCECDGCEEDPVLCALYTTLSGLMVSCIRDPKTIKEEDLVDIKGCVQQFLDALMLFDKDNPSYDIAKDFDREINLIKKFLEAGSMRPYIDAYNAIRNILKAIEAEGGCTCGDDNDAIEDLFNQIKEILEDHFSDVDDIKDFTEQIEYVNLILDLINEFNDTYPNLDIIKDLAEYINILNDFLNNPNSSTLDAAIGAIRDILDYLNDLGGGRFEKLPAKTLLHEVCWLSLEAYEYNQNIPQQPAISQDVRATIAGITKFIQPIWRPSTSYLVHFKLRDTVDNNEQQPPADYNFTYGFTTAGPVGYFHIDPASTYGDLLIEAGDKIGDFTVPELSILDDPNGKLRHYDDGSLYPDNVNNAIIPHPDLWPLTSLKRYIDYERSYPNADGNLLSAKPLFYNDNRVSQIYLYFTKAYATHFFHNWMNYDNAGTRAGRLKIIIKDPAESETIVNPPYLDYDPQDTTTINIPQTVEEWATDDHPLMPFVISQWSNLFNTPGNCVISGGLPIKPASSYSIIKLKNLKPLKLYTAIVNNLYDAAGDPDFDELTEMREVHRFVFQTSRYANFTEQINSYILTDEDGEVERKAIFAISKELTALQIDNVWKTMNNTPNPADALIPNYQHAFDRVIEGILGLNPLDAAISTEFNIIRNIDDNNKAVAIWIRNPEPFNIPKIPLEQMTDAIEVLTGGSPDAAFKVLHSKDYSQALIMHSSKAIPGSAITVQFRFKMWDGYAYVNLDEHPPVTIDIV